MVALEFVFMNVCRARLQHERLEPFDAGMVRPRFFKPTVTTRARHCSSWVGLGRCLQHCSRHCGYTLMSHGPRGGGGVGADHES